MSAGTRPRVVILRGHQMNSWHIRPWSHLSDRFDVVALHTHSNWFDTGSTGVTTDSARTLRDVLPPGRLGHVLSRLPGDRYLNLRPKLEGAAIVHSQDLGFWYSMQAAKHKRQLGYRLVLTVWETIPFLDAYRNIRTRPYRRRVLEATDLFLAATERARLALLMEGAPADRVKICPPGVDQSLFKRPSGSVQPDREHLVISSGRLVWEKGHQDVLRAVAALRRGLIDGVPDALAAPRVLVVGAGPEDARLRRYAEQLGIGDLVDIWGEVPYAEMPALYARASCLVLASLPVWFWEEQFGMVLAEALASGLAIAAASSGAIPEVVGNQASLFAPGDWPALAEILAEGPLSQPPGTRIAYEEALVDTYSSAAHADRLASAYGEVLAMSTITPR